MKRAVIFSNGELADLSRVKKLIKKSDLLVGVDGGTKHVLKLELEPDLIIGDLDSLEVVPKNVPVIKYPRDKDFTDTELALNYCQKQNFDEIVLVGWLGRRLDHMISSLMNISQLPLTISLVEGNQRLFVVKYKIEITGTKGDLVSLIPLLGDCLGVTTVGLKWRLRGDSLKVGSSRGVSNVMLGKSARVSLKKGCLLVIHTYKVGP